MIPAEKIRYHLTRGAQDVIRAELAALRLPDSYREKEPLLALLSYWGRAMLELEVDDE